MSSLNQQSIFDVLPADFFQILAVGPRRNNYDYLIIIDDFFKEDQLDVDKDRLVSYLTKYIKDTHTFDDENDEEDKEAGFNPAAKAGNFVNRLIRSGWLDRDDGKNFTDRVSRTEAFLKIVPVLRDLASSEYQVSEYDGPLLQIFKLVYPNFDIGSPIVALETIDKNSDLLSEGLLSINSKLKRFIRKAMENPDVSNEKMLDTLLNQFSKTPAVVALNNLMTKNNPNKYSGTIINKLSEQKAKDKNDKLIKAYIELKDLDPNDPASTKQASSFVNGVLDKVIAQFQEIDGYLDIIGERNHHYVTTTKNNLKFRLNNYRDVQADINECLKSIQHVGEDFDYSESVRIGIYQIMDAYSLYKPRNLTKKAAESIVLEEVPVDESAEKDAKNLLEEQAKYSRKSIEEFVAKNMGEKSEIKASDFSHGDFESFIKLMLVPVFSTNSRSSFTCTTIDGGKFKYSGYLIDDFLIQKKGSSHEQK